MEGKDKLKHLSPQSALEKKKAKLTSNCTSSSHNLKCCVLRMCRLDSTDMDKLFDMAHEASADSWSGLFDNHECWCHCWFCAVSAFHIENGTEELHCALS